MKRIVVLDPISEDAARRLEQETGWKVEQHYGLSPEELPAAVENADVIVVRSATKVTADVIAAAKRLKVIGRAGIGVDNIDLEAATERGIVVMNTPTGNTTTTGELAIALLCSLARHVPRADRVAKGGTWSKKPPCSS